MLARLSTAALRQWPQGEGTVTAILESLSKLLTSTDLPILLLGIYSKQITLKGRVMGICTKMFTAAVVFNSKTIK